MEFQLPNIGEGVDSADIAELLIAEGDTIQADQVVMELETDKAVVELPCPHAGTVQKLLVSEGDTVAVGQALFSLETGNGQPQNSDEQTAEAAETEQPSAAAEAAPEPRPAPADDKSAEEAAAHEEDPEPAAGRTIEFTLPNIGEGVDSADVADLHVAAGDLIEPDQIVMELETDKAVVELPCPHGGTVAAVHVSAGDTVQVGQKLLTLDGVRAKGGDAGAKKSAPADAAPQQAGKRPAKEPAIGHSSETETKSKPPSESERTQQAVAVARQAEIVTGEDGGQPPVPAAPSTRRLARQLGVNLREVRGSGPGGRITQEDVQQFVKGRLTGGLPALSGGEMSGSGVGLAPPPLPDFSKFGRVDREKLNKLSRTAAENLVVSWSVIPHVTQHDRADVTELEAARKKFTKGAGASGPKVTMTAIVMKALATALQQNPKFNSSLDPQTMEIIYKRYYHIGCAVDTPHGLLVPVVRDVDSKSIRQVAAEIAELAEQARDRKLPVESMQGATCTVTNLGGIGGVAFTPIVNYPEVCILGLARGQKELQLGENGQVIERMMLPLSLSYDHRVINGADAAKFLVSLSQMLSDPFQLLSAI